MDTFVLAVLTVGFVWLLRPARREHGPSVLPSRRSFRPTRASSDEIWAQLDKALDARTSKDPVTAARRSADRKAGDMAVGDRGFVAVTAVGYDHSSSLWVRTDARVELEWSNGTPVEIVRAHDGFQVSGPLGEHDGHVGAWLRKGAALPAYRRPEPC